MSVWMKTVEDALAEARDADDPCCANCTRTALTLLADEVERLRGMEARAKAASVAGVDAIVRDAALHILNYGG